MHFTYAKLNSLEKGLKQGDILRRTDALNNLLKEFHPHYLDEKYTHFQILTQSCDLVLGRSGKNCKAKYISISAVRDFEEILEDKILEVSGEVVNFDGRNYLSSEHKFKIASFVAKIFNNNEPNYFYLKAEPSYGFMKDSCTILPLSIAIRSSDHYELCVEAKVLELTSEFQAKLGWTVGNLYSRIGTKDYAPGIGINSDGFNSLVDKTINDHLAWVHEENFSDFKRFTHTSINFEEISKKIIEKNTRRRTSRLDTLVGKINSVIELEGEQKIRLKNLLGNDPLVAKLFD